MNEKIISEFEKLVNFIRSQKDEAIKNKNTKESTANTFRLRQVSISLGIIKKYTKELTLDTISDFSEYPGIGKGTIDRIKEIMKNSFLAEIANFKDESNENKKALEELESIVGIGRSNALEFIKKGILSVEQLKDKIAKNEIEVNDKILLGIKYYGLFQGNIPREEITNVYKLIKSIIDRLNKKYKLDDENKYIFEICGSYRREKTTSGDIDILVSKLGTEINDADETHHLERFILKLKENIKKNDNKPLLVDDMTDKNYKTKYMGFAKYKTNPVRRIDIRYVPFDAYYSALLYFTGSAELNKQMRQVAKKMKLKLSEYGLTKEDGTMIPITSEYEVFKILKMEYLAPRLR